MKLPSFELAASCERLPSFGCRVRRDRSYATRAFLKNPTRHRPHAFPFIATDILGPVRCRPCCRRGRRN